MNIVYVYADSPEEWNCSEWRCAVPARAINRSGRHNAALLSIEAFAKNTPDARSLCDTADVIIVQRSLFGPILPAIQHWKARDKVVIADFDDAYHLMPATNPAYPFWGQGLILQEGQAPQKMEPPPLTQFKWGLRLVHAATVPSERLADDWRSYTDIYYLPNYIDLDNYRNISPEPHEKIVIGWGGSMSHLQSFKGSGILTALENVCQARPQVQVMVCGNDKRVFDRIPLPPEQKRMQPWVSYRDWPRVLAQFDIGLAPLHGPYDERRSWIKVLEYMLMKIPWIASEGPAYNVFRPFGWLVKNTAGSWERMLLDMIDHHEDYRLEAACAPYLFALSQSVDENVDKIIGTYSAIAAKVVGKIRVPNP